MKTALPGGHPVKIIQGPAAILLKLGKYIRNGHPSDYF